jgi:heavy metal translocating P-type ATPase
MLVEILLFGGGIAVWHRQKKRKKKLTGVFAPSNNRVAERAQSAKKQDKFSFSHLLKDINDAMKGDGSRQLKLDIDPQLRQQTEEIRKTGNRQLALSAGAVTLALFGNVYPALRLAGVAGVLYLSRNFIYLSWNDLKRGHYLSGSVLGLVMFTGTLALGKLVLVAFGALIGNLFAKIINRVENTSRERLINVFSGHTEKVWLRRDGMEIQIDFHDVRRGDVIIVNAGEVIPVDGRIQEGECQIDQQILTGESQPVEKSVGDPVFASTLLIAGRLAIEVETTGSETVAAKIGTILNNTQSYRDTLINRGRQIADGFIPITAGLSATSLIFFGPTAAIAVLWSGLGGLMALYGPLTVLTYLQILSRQNILIKDGRVFESLRKVDTIVFDKTGTLTLEQPTLVAVHSLGSFDERTVLRYAAAAEYRQVHPVAKAILAKAQAEGIAVPDPESTNYEVGFGISVSCEGHTIGVGSLRYMQREEVEIPTEAHRIAQQTSADCHSLVYVTIDNQLAGILELEPTIRPEAARIIAYMKQRGMKLSIMSGDSEGVTRRMANTLGIDHYFAEVLPETKADLVKELCQQGRFVCFIGDGINDAIALKSAHVSISLKGASTAATDTAQIIFMDCTLNKLEDLFRFSDEFENTMKKNFAISIVPGFIIIGGVYFFSIGIGPAMIISYTGIGTGITNVLWPLVKHQTALRASNSDTPS